MAINASQLLSTKWLDKARKYVANPKRMKLLLVQLGACLTKDGLAQAKEHLLLLYHYVKDVVSGRYKGYSPTHLVMVTGVLIYVVSPFDFLPDMLPVGLLDDSSLILWAVKEMADEMEKYKSFHNGQEG